MIATVWPNVYLNTWFDTFHESQLPFPRDVIPHPFIHQLTILFGLLGLGPTLIALYGAFVSARRVVREPRSTADLGMWILALGTVSAFVLFSIRIPTWAALKASYLFGLSLPYAFFLVRGSESLRGVGLGAMAPLWIGLLAVATTYVFATGRPPGLMRRDFDSMQMHQVRAHFGDFEATRLIFRFDAPQRNYVEARAAVEIFDDNPQGAIRFYRRAGQMEASDPGQERWWLNRLAVAHALADQPERARLLLDQALELGIHEEMLVNRAALRIANDDWAGAERDLQAAIERAPALPPAWIDLAVVQDHLGKHDDAAKSAARAEEVRSLAPRGFPYGVGNGFLHGSGAGQRFMLIVDSEGAASLYRPPRARNHQRRVEPSRGE
jgi:hypothetical protein